MTHLNTLTTNVCLAIVGNPPAMVRIVFSDPSSSFQLLEIPETRESVAKRGLLGRVFRKKRFSEGSDSDFIVCSRVDRQGQFLLVVDSSGLFSLVDLTLLSCVAQVSMS